MIRLNFLPSFIEARLMDFPVPRERLRTKAPWTHHHNFDIFCHKCRKGVRLNRHVVKHAGFGPDDCSVLLFVGNCRTRGCRTGYYDCYCVDPEEAAALNHGGVVSAGRYR